METLQLSRVYHHRTGQHGTSCSCPMFGATWALDNIGQHGTKNAKSCPMLDPRTNCSITWDKPYQTHNSTVHSSVPDIPNTIWNSCHVLSCPVPSHSVLSRPPLGQQCIAAPFGEQEVLLCCLHSTQHNKPKYSSRVAHGVVNRGYVMMEDMDIDHVVDIPDTPDRPVARHINAGDCVGKESKLRQLVGENGHNGRRHMHPRKNPSSIDKIEHFSDAIALSPVDTPYTSQNASLFRRTATDKNSKHETSGSQQNHEKLTSASYHSVSPRVTGQKRLVRNGCISPYNIESRAKQLAERAQNCSNDVEQNPSRDMVSLRPCMIDVSDIVAEDNKHDRGKGVTIRSCTSKEHGRGKGVTIGPGTIDASDIVAEDNKHDRGKGVIIRPCTSKEHGRGKGVTFRPCSSKEHDRVHLSRSPPSRDAFGCNEELGGWRSTHHHLKKVDHSLSNANGSKSRRNDDVGCFAIKRLESSDNRSGKAYGPREQNADQTAPRLVSELDQINQPRLVGNAVTKRQKQHELTSRNRGQSSKMVSDGSEIVFLGSSGESSRPRSSTIRSHQNHGIVEINELSPETRHGNSQGVVCINDDDSAARTRQVEADEMLALRLQEQLYDELPAFGGDEIDADIAWFMQQEEDVHPLSNQNRHGSNPPQSRLLPNPSNRRGLRARVHTSTGMEPLRNRFLNRARAAPLRARNFQFPLGMDLDVRLDILEALEAAVGDLGESGTARHISGLQRDFNENDYEMLLALDENNHQTGASASQINSLPLSTVQTENFEEACAICLDTPAIGETIRHLPCLHKFHKACIDPWLSRKSSCPICKSSVT
ncbi:hypothetical protein JRO89_XS03G0064800 [Xanthoceras sorbifolium]|uniref:RING-type domain-containing protein n=1 Tax=Xanthoceras sorbifolium TaxID=99658 RepID=A0ABQ8I9D5_9ROSI|nr:hypothetical protein JRO89_XS03G0064800 [Xanthoceras sorbifolium]